MHHQIPITPDSIIDITHPDDGAHEIARDLAYRRLLMVNVVFAGVPGSGDRRWVLIDTGLPGLAGRIEQTASERFGPGSRPSAIVMTHGHFDHIGSLQKLAEKWDTPIYAHPLEFRYLNGEAAYPPPDPSVGGGVMPLLSPLFPRGPLDVRSKLLPLPEDGSVPGMSGWRWLHTPGHSAGHVSLWRESDGALIAGDAFITKNQESAYAVAVQKTELHGPPMYFTPDWGAAHESVRMLAGLNPEIVVTGHGRALHGTPMRQALEELALRFEEIAVPEGGRYVGHPAVPEDGTAYVRHGE